MKVDYPRIYEIRKPEGFVPAVQRWSVTYPANCSAVHVGFFAVQAENPEDISASGFLEWVGQAMQGAHAPVSVDHAVFKDDVGATNRIVTAYWVDAHAFLAWRLEQQQLGWWDDEARTRGPCGFWRELLTVPTERMETLYWQDYAAALSKALPIEPTPYCGYFGAMRDRIPLAACDPLAAGGATELRAATPARDTRNKRWFVTPPHNLAMIRSASFWGNCDEDQKADYDQKLRDPLAQGMAFLKNHPEESGCATLRFQQTLGEGDTLVAETHAHGYFLSLKHMENWAEGHASHEAIFSAAIARYRKYGPRNQLRTWHEVYVLPQAGQHFEYINCHNRTGLLAYFEGVSL